MNQNIISGISTQEAQKRLIQYSYNEISEKKIISKFRTIESFAGRAEFKITGFKPFDPVEKRTEAAIEGADGIELRVSKGAPQVILSLCLIKKLLLP